MSQELNTKAEFDSLRSSSPGKLVVVAYMADWNGPWRAIAPKFAQLANSTPGVVFANVNVDKNSETAEWAGISGMPTFICYKDGAVLGEVVGANYDGLVNMVKSHL